MEFIWCIDWSELKQDTTSKNILMREFHYGVIKLSEYLIKELLRYLQMEK